jgi:hypothetical protein
LSRSFKPGGITLDLASSCRSRRSPSRRCCDGPDGHAPAARCSGLSCGCIEELLLYGCNGIALDVMLSLRWSPTVEVWGVAWAIGSKERSTWGVNGLQWHRNGDGAANGAGIVAGARGNNQTSRKGCAAAPSSPRSRCKR